MRILITGLVLGAFAVGGAAAVSFAQAEGREYAPPKLVWERTYEKDIVAVGIDEDCFSRDKGNVNSCLKWVLFTGRNLWISDSGGKLMSEPVEGSVSRHRVSANGKYFFGVGPAVESKKKERRAIYTLFNWDGERIWETDQFVSRPVVRNDGSAVSRLEKIGLDDIRDTKERSRGAMFFDAQGKVTNIFEFPEVHYRWGYRHGYSISDGFFAMVRLSPKKEYELYVFKKNGSLAWKQKQIRRRFVDQGNTSGAHTSGGVVVSDRGEVVFLFDNRAEYGTQAFIYDETGELRDTLLLYRTGILYPPRAEGRLAFVSTGRRRGVPSHFLCYDLEKMKVRFVIEAEYDQPFGHFDVDSRAGLIALAVHPVGARKVVRMFDLDGSYKTEVIVGARSGDFWFKLLDGALLVAEKSSLRLYALEEGE